MEKKINIAELLKDCPKGMKLDCTTWENVTFEKVMDNTIFIKRNDKPSFDTLVVLNKYGCATDYPDEKCRIFPKGKTTWEGFMPPCLFKDGDVLTYMYCNKPTIYIYRENGRCNTSYYAGYSSENERFYKGKGGLSGDRTDLRLATKDEKQKLFDVIKANGYCWDAETKTLKNLFPYNIGTKVWVKSDTEHKYIHTIVGMSRNSFGNLEYEVKEEKTGVVVHYPESLLIPVTEEKPNFKLWDTIKNKNDNTIHTINYIYRDSYGLCDGHLLYFKEQDQYELVPKFKVGDKIRCKANPIFVFTITNITKDQYECGKSFVLRFNNQDDYELVPNKFDINTLKPFDKVLVRPDNKHRWSIQFFERLNKKLKASFVCMGGWRYHQCIPYESNEHLLHTADDCDSFFKVWKES